MRTLADIDDALTIAHASEVRYRELGETGLARQWNRQVDRLLDERREVMGLTPAGSTV
jgi:hypothetical protein